MPLGTVRPKATPNANEPSLFDQTTYACVYGLKIVRKIAGYYQSRTKRK